MRLSSARIAAMSGGFVRVNSRSSSSSFICQRGRRKTLVRFAFEIVGGNASYKLHSLESNTLLVSRCGSAQKA